MEVIKQLQLLDERISRHLPWYGKGRKWHGNWYHLIEHAARDLNTPGREVHWLHPDLWGGTGTECRDTTEPAPGQSAYLTGRPRRPIGSGHADQAPEPPSGTEWLHEPAL
jgi:hypothetical protein